jgi:hypothetical protein
MLSTQALLWLVSSLDSICQQCHPTQPDILACPLQLAYPFQEQIKVEMRPQAGYTFCCAEMRKRMVVIIISEEYACIFDEHSKTRRRVLIFEKPQ